MTPRIRELTVVRFLFNTLNNRRVVRTKLSHMHFFKIRASTDDMMLIHSA